MDEELIVVKHCEEIACDSAPHVCPVCGKEVDYSRVTIPSYLPNPVTNAHAKQHRLSVVLKPTTGTWYNAVKSENDLHIGVTDSSGEVVNYFLSGVERNAVGWERSLAVYQVSPSELEQWDHIWISILEDMELDVSWSSDYYEENEHNCFDFVLEFLRKFCNEVEKRCGCIAGLEFLNGQLKNKALMKQTFVDAHAFPSINQAKAYVDLSDAVKKMGFAKIS